MSEFLQKNVTIFKYSHKHSVHFSFSVTKRCETDLFILHKQQLSMCSIRIQLSFVSFNYFSLDIMHSYSFTKFSRTIETLYIYIYMCVCVGWTFYLKPWYMYIMGAWSLSNQLFASLTAYLAYWVVVVITNTVMYMLLNDE